MYTNFTFPWITLTILLLLSMAVLVWNLASTDRARKCAIAGMSLSLTLMVVALCEVSLSQSHQLFEPLGLIGVKSWFSIDTLNAIPITLFTALALGLTIFAPKRKLTPYWLSGMLLLTASTLTAYAANNMAILVVGWAGSTVPFLVKKFFSLSGEKEIPSLSRIALIGSVVSLLVAVLCIVFDSLDTKQILSFSVHSGNSPLLHWAFGFLIVSVFLRKGLLPVHSWVISAYERGPLLPLTLLVNSHLGAFLVARLASPLLPDVAHKALPILGEIGLITAAYTAILALAERQPRKLLGLLSISQASFILVGLESNNPDAIVGAFVHWQVVAVATTILAAVYTSIEARLSSSTFDGEGFLGLAASTPRLAVFFAIGGLALVGVPLTLGFCAEDLLLHGTLVTHPHLGIVLPIVTALNAFHVVRLFARLFLGQPKIDTTAVVDALARERWVLTAALLFLIIGGIFPAPLVRLPTATAKKLVSTVTFQDRK